jgi:hypothetical protein
VPFGPRSGDVPTRSGGQGQFGRAVLAATAGMSPSRRMEKYGSPPRTGSASSIRDIFRSTDSRHRYTSKK